MVNEYNDPGYRRMSEIGLAGFLARSAVNGPGIRAVVWVQGCPRRCAGCFNPEFQPFSPAEVTDTDELARRILAIPEIDGVTFSGGEPFAQAGPLARVGRQVRAAGLDVVTYSGYTCSVLVSGDDPEWSGLLEVTDILVAGPYVQELSCTGGLAGSSNQQVIALTERGRKTLPSAGAPPARSMEFTIRGDGTIILTGFPAPGTGAGTALRTGGA